MLEEELYALLLRLLDLDGIGGHIALLPAVGDGDLRAEADGGAGHVHRDVAAADDDDLFADGGLGAGVDLAQEIDAAPDALELLARDAEGGGLLRADGEIKRVKALGAQLVERHVPADLDTAAEDHAELLQNVDLGVEDGLLEAEVRDAVAEHTAGLVVFIEDGDLVVVRREEVGAAQARGARADDGDLLVAEVIELLRDKAGVALELAVGDEALDLVDGDGAVNVAAGADILALAVADAAADGGEGVFLLDKLERLEIPALGGELEIALDGDVRGTRGLAGGCPLGRDVLAVGAVLGVPVLRRPLDIVGQVHGLMFDGRFGAELLAHLDGVIRAAVGALAAGDALFLVDLRDIVAAGGAGGVVILAHPEGEAAFGHTVADGEGLALVERRDLVDAAALVALFDEGLGLLHGAGAALAGAVEHIAHVAHEDAQPLVEVAAALAHHLAHAAALAGRDAEMAVVILDILADKLVVDGGGAGGDGALDGDDAHDARAHGGVRRVLDLACGGVLVEGVGDFGVLEAELLVDEQKFKDAGGVGRQKIDLQPHLGDHDLHHKADIEDLVQDFPGALDAHFRLAGDDGDEGRLHIGQGQHDGDLLVRDPLLEDLVLRAVGRDFIVPAVDFFAQLDQILSDCQRCSLLKI